MKRYLLPLLFVAAFLLSPLTAIAAGKAPGPEPPDPAPVVARTSPGLHSDTAVRYTVRAGDSLWSIATYYGVPVSVIAQANAIKPTGFVYPGMQLLIPWSNPRGSARYDSAGGDPLVKGAGLHFVASIARQTCWLYHDAVVVERWPCSTGRPASPSFPGNYTVQSKLTRAYGDIWDFWMPHWLGIYAAGALENGIHGLPYDAKTGEVAWRDNIGEPVTYGCVMLAEKPARSLFERAYVGMPVTILP